MWYNYSMIWLRFEPLKSCGIAIRKSGVQAFSCCTAAKDLMKLTVPRLDFGSKENEMRILSKTTAEKWLKEWNIANLSVDDLVGINRTSEEDGGYQTPKESEAAKFFIYVEEEDRFVVESGNTTTGEATILCGLRGEILNPCYGRGFIIFGKFVTIECSLDDHEDAIIPIAVTIEKHGVVCKKGFPQIESENVWLGESETLPANLKHFQNGLNEAIKKSMGH